MVIATLSTALDFLATSHTHTHVHSHTSSSSSSLSGLREVIPLLFLLTGPAFYMYQYRRYRNQDKRHHHERETVSDIANVQAADQYSRSISGSRHSSMSSSNEYEVRG
jgi:hypothetical protein